MSYWSCAGQSWPLSFFAVVGVQLLLCAGVLAQPAWRRELLSYAPSLAVCTAIGGLIASQMILPSGIRILAVWLLYVALYRMVHRKESIGIASLYAGTFLSVLADDILIGWLQHLHVIADPGQARFVVCHVGGHGWADGLILSPLLAITFGLAWRHRRGWPSPLPTDAP